MHHEQLLRIWLEEQPSARSPSTLYGNPPMWETLRDDEDDLVLFTRPGKVQERPAPLAPYQEIDGVHYRWQRDGQWVGQSCQSSFKDFAANGPAKIGIPQPTRPPLFSDEFNWSGRVGEPVLVLPFVEGRPSPENAQGLSNWVKRHSDKYLKKFVRLYHATDPRLPIESEGLKPTSATRRRSFQSESGYVYLANTPARAKMFGDLGNGGKSVVYEVIVSLRALRADMDQLSNQRAVGVQVGNSIGESIVYGGGVRIKGGIEPWAIRQLSGDEYQRIEERNARLWGVGRLEDQPGMPTLFAECVRSGVLRSEGGLYDADWRAIEKAFVRQAILEQNYEPELVRDAVLAYSPLAVLPAHASAVDRDIASAAAKRPVAEAAGEQSAGRRLRPGR